MCVQPKKPLSSTPTPSIKFVYKSKERYHPPTHPPTPPQTSKVFTSPRKVIIPHAYKSKECYHPPTPTKTVQPAVHPKQPTQWWSMMQISFLGRVAAAGPSACAWACGALRCTSSSPSPTNRTGGEKRVPCFLFDSFSPSRVFLVTGKCTKRCEKELIAWLFQDFQYVVSLESLEMIYDFTF